MDFTKDRTWAEIRLDNIEHNYRAIRQKLPPGCRFLGTVKANAYGHGMVAIAKFLSDLGADYLAVACIDEAIALRRAGLGLPILVFGYTEPSRTGQLIEFELTQTVFSLELAEAYSQAALGNRLKCHLKLDSGMGRLGFDCDETGFYTASLALDMPRLDFEGVFSHFAVSDSWGDSYTQSQFNKFKKVVADLETKSGRKFEIIHCANSGAVINSLDTYLDMVRPGIALYGAYEEPSPNLESFGFRPGMELKTRIVQIKNTPKGTTVGYGRTYSADSIRKIAVVPAGYADGLHRGLSNRMEMLLHGKRIKQVGRICMDMCMVDITDIKNAHIGDVVTIFGDSVNEYGGRGGSLSVSEHARKLGTITYELLCSVSARVPRVYLRSDSIPLDCK